MEIAHPTLVDSIVHHLSIEGEHGVPLKAVAEWISKVLGIPQPNDPLLDRRLVLRKEVEVFYVDSKSTEVEEHTDPYPWWSFPLDERKEAAKRTVLQQKNDSSKTVFVRVSKCFRSDILRRIQSDAISDSSGMRSLLSFVARYRRAGVSLSDCLRRCADGGDETVTLARKLERMLENECITITRSEEGGDRVYLRIFAPIVPAHALRRKFYPFGSGEPLYHSISRCLLSMSQLHENHVDVEDLCTLVAADADVTSVSKDGARIHAVFQEVIRDMSQGGMAHVFESAAAEGSLDSGPCFVRIQHTDGQWTKLSELVSSPASVPSSSNALDSDLHTDLRAAHTYELVRNAALVTGTKGRTWASMTSAIGLSPRDLPHNRKLGLVSTGGIGVKNVILGKSTMEYLYLEGPKRRPEDEFLLPSDVRGPVRERWAKLLEGEFRTGNLTTVAASRMRTITLLFWRHVYCTIVSIRYAMCDGDTKVSAEKRANTLYGKALHRYISNLIKYDIVRRVPVSVVGDDSFDVFGLATHSDKFDKSDPKFKEMLGRHFVERSSTDTQIPPTVSSSSAPDSSVVKAADAVRDRKSTKLLAYATGVLNGYLLPLRHRLWQFHRRLYRYSEARATRVLPVIAVLESMSFRELCTVVPVEFGDLCAMVKDTRATLVASSMISSALEAENVMTMPISELPPVLFRMVFSKDYESRLRESLTALFEDLASLHIVDGIGSSSSDDERVYEFVEEITLPGSGDDASTSIRISGLGDVDDFWKSWRSAELDGQTGWSYISMCQMQKWYEVPLLTARICTSVTKFIETCNGIDTSQWTMDTCRRVEAAYAEHRVTDRPLLRFYTCCLMRYQHLFVHDDTATGASSTSSGVRRGSMVHPGFDVSGSVVAVQKPAMSRCATITRKVRMPTVQRSRRHVMLSWDEYENLYFVGPVSPTSVSPYDVEAGACGTPDVPDSKTAIAIELQLLQCAFTPDRLYDNDRFLRIFETAPEGSVDTLLAANLIQLDVVPVSYLNETTALCNRRVCPAIAILEGLRLDTAGIVNLLNDAALPPGDPVHCATAADVYNLAGHLAERYITSDSSGAGVRAAYTSAHTGTGVSEVQSAGGLQAAADTDDDEDFNVPLNIPDVAIPESVPVLSTLRSELVDRLDSHGGPVILYDMHGQANGDLAVMLACRILAFVQRRVFVNEREVGEEFAHWWPFPNAVYYVLCQLRHMNVVTVRPPESDDAAGVLYTVNVVHHNLVN